MFGGKKNLGKDTMYTGIEVIPRLFRPAFSFSPVVLLVKVILIRNCK